MAKFNFKKGDIVEVIAGDDKGTKAELLAVMPKKNKVIVKGVRIAKKAIKPTEQNPQGGFLSKEMPVDVSNVRKVEA
ncbi:MAG: 50S ribosomal protein L24 [Sulfuricurvum sp.]|uniref:50S ribosomal protein L24 n=1 Tax=Sulfuricurvum sp. TaxID=2025608 RepID=UPI00263916BB|nr:50S ribosomal protein L24 [Sulfuricurvum sp.]MDD2828158.1 50S ribosomal protein L24 [Sulfuricurvum sp.]MDD4949887.1 50S ribosomal protein L24 [Sulfuricurvum sp.]